MHSEYPGADCENVSMHAVTDSGGARPLEAWPATWGESRPRRNIGMLWVGIALLAVGAVMAGFSAGAPGPLWSGVILGLFGVTACAVAARRPFGRGGLRLVETATLMRGREQSPDVRVFFAPERPAGVALHLLSAVWAVVLAAGTVVAVQIGVSARPQALLGAVALAVLAVLFAYAAVRGAVARYRFDSFGRRPVGLGIGPDGVDVIRVTSIIHLPWAAIRSVEADLTEPRRGVDRLPLIRLRLDPKQVSVTNGGRATSTITVAAAVLRVHPQVTWSALRTFHRSPSSRALLGTASGQALFDEWRRQVS